MKHLDISKSEYIKILKNRGKSIKRSASKQKIIKLIGILTKRDLIICHDSIKWNVNALEKDTDKKKLTTLHQELCKRNLVQEIPKHVEEIQKQRIINKVLRKELKQEICRNI